MTLHVLTSSHIVRGEEPLLSVEQLSHPPALCVFEEDGDDISLHQIQLVGPLGPVVIHCHHLGSEEISVRHGSVSARYGRLYHDISKVMFGNGMLRESEG